MTPNFRVAVQTGNMRLYYKLLKLFEGSRLKAKFFTPRQNIPVQDYDLIVTTEGKTDYNNEVQFLNLKFEEINSDLLIKILSRIARNQEPTFKQVIIGVDPGKKIGVAVICDGMLLTTAICDLEQLPITVKNFLVSFPSERIIIRVGNQPYSVSNVIFNKLFSAFSEDEKIKLEIVQEEFSSLKGTLRNQSLDSDEIAAFRIAQRPGIEQKHLVRNEVPSGRIAEIKKWSRNHSQNRITLDEELAKAVALGELSLDEAIILKEKELEARKNE
jgi:hypothetical protein